VVTLTGYPVGYKRLSAKYSQVLPLLFNEEPAGQNAATVAQPVKLDNDLYVRDYSRCILCYKCVEACGVDAQNTFAIAVAGQGFDARISIVAIALGSAQLVR
jgi:predicted molibdopterin-dependent oxidoreductase YjgC